MRPFEGRYEHDCLEHLEPTDEPFRFECSKCGSGFWPGDEATADFGIEDLDAYAS